jgi:hypothetical protein
LEDEERLVERPATRSSVNVDGKKRKAEEELSRGDPEKPAKSQRRQPNDSPARVSKLSNIRYYDGYLTILE